MKHKQIKVRDFNEIETVIILSKYARIHKLAASVWTNDSVVINSLERMGAICQSKYCYELSLLDFLILPKKKKKESNRIIKYPEIIILPNDNLDKETAIYFTQADRKKKILHISTEDEYFLARCKKFNLPYIDGAFVSHDDFRAFGKKAKLSEEERVLRAERMREAKRLGMLNG